MFNRLLSTFGLKLQRKYIGTEQTKDAAKALAKLLDDRLVETVFDVGANIGDATYNYRRYFPQAKVHAFEPATSCVNVLKERFGHDRKIQIVNAGVGEKAGAAQLNLSIGPKQNSILTRPQKIGVYKDDRQEIKGTELVDIVALDEYAIRKGINVINLLKIDVEGAESLVIKGCKNLLQNSAVDVICIEVMFVELFEGQELFVQIAESLFGFNYTLYDIPFMHHAPNGQLLFADAIFVSQNVRAEVVDQGISGTT